MFSESRAHLSARTEARRQGDQRVLAESHRQGHSNAAHESAIECEPSVERFFFGRF